MTLLYDTGYSAETGGEREEMFYKYLYEDVRGSPVEK